DDVPSLGQHGQEQRADAELDERVRPIQRQQRERRQHGQAQRDAKGFHAVLPSRPLGRTMSTSTRTPKLATSVKVGPAYRAARASIRPRTRPPAMTPRGVSRPPMMAMAKDLAVSVAPM